MDEGEERHVPRSRWRRSLSWIPDLLVVALVAFAFLAWHFDLGARWGTAAADTATGPARVLPPQGLVLPAQHAAPVVAAPLTSADASPAKVARAVSGLLADPRLGPHVGVLVTDFGSGRVLFRRGAGSVTPASTMKLLTSVAALESIGPSQRFATTVRRVPGSNQIVLVGGGDPFLLSKPAPGFTYPQRSDLQTLARATAKALLAGGTRTVRLAYDDSLFTGPRTPPTWPASYLTGGVAPPISALWVDEGHQPGSDGYVSDPAKEAGRVFSAALAKQRIKVVGAVAHHPAPTGAVDLASVSSPPLGQIVSRMVLVSDNNAAEVVAHHVGLKVLGEGSFEGGAAAVRQVLGRLGVPLGGAVIHDGSGLSRSDRLRPRTLSDVLKVAGSPAHPQLRELITGLPVAGFTGSLQYRFNTGPAAGRGRVQAKTGTLSGVHGLAGVATDLDGDVLGFVAIADRVPMLDQEIARIVIDRVAAALGACHCGAGT